MARRRIRSGWGDASGSQGRSRKAKRDEVEILKRVTISLLVGALAFLAAFIITINFYTTWKAFAHQAATRSSALFAGFLTAGIVSAIAFGGALYLIGHKKTSAK